MVVPPSVYGSDETIVTEFVQIACQFLKKRGSFLKLTGLVLAGRYFRFTLLGLA
jgi:hypothetical protein